MQAAPAVQVNILRFGVWNAALAVLSVTSLSAVAAWFATRGDDLPAWSDTVVIAALLIALFGAGGLLRRQPVALRWDSQHWHVTEARRGAVGVEPAQVQVMIDAGGWLLLKFRRDASQSPLKARWIPVQRRGIESHWHALRCAVYSSSAPASAGHDGPAGRH